MTRHRDDRSESENGGESRYGEELLSANWNPVIELLPCAGSTAERARSEQCNVSDEEARAFLGRIYAFGA